MPRVQGTILIVEDNPETRHVLERVLAVRRYKTVSVGDGPAALRHLQSNEVRLIILDVHLPGMDGHEVLRELRDDPHLAKIPVVVYSADPEPIEGVAAYIRKATADPDMLLDAIAGCLRETSVAI